MYALDSLIDLAPGSIHAALNQAVGGHIIEQAEFFGTFGSGNRPLAADDSDEVPAEINIGTDAEAESLTSEPDATYPAPDSQRTGVRTNKGTDPVSTDEGDEQNEGKIYGTPDDSTPGYGNEEKDIYLDKPYIG